MYTDDNISLDRMPFDILNIIMSVVMTNKDGKTDICQLASTNKVMRNTVKRTRYMDWTDNDEERKHKIISKILSMKDMNEAEQIFVRNHDNLPFSHFSSFCNMVKYSIARYTSLDHFVKCVDFIRHKGELTPSLSRNILTKEFFYGRNDYDSHIWFMFDHSSFVNIFRTFYKDSKRKLSRYDYSDGVGVLNSQLHHYNPDGNFMSIIYKKNSFRNLRFLFEEWKTEILIAFRLFCEKQHSRKEKLEEYINLARESTPFTYSCVSICLTMEEFYKIFGDKLYLCEYEKSNSNTFEFDIPIPVYEHVYIENIWDRDINRI